MVAWPFKWWRDEGGARAPKCPSPTLAPCAAWLPAPPRECQDQAETVPFSCGMSGTAAVTEKVWAWLLVSAEAARLVTMIGQHSILLLAIGILFVPPPPKRLI